MKGLLMKHSSSTYFAGIALTSAALFLGACVNSSDEQALDPFANAKVDARVAGATMAESFDQSKGWSNTMTAPVTLQPLSDVSTKLGGLKKEASLPKLSSISNGSDTSGAIYTDTAASKGGILIFYSESHSVFAVTKDTAVIKWDANAKDSTPNNEHAISWKRISTYIGGKVETSEFRDGDGDGIVTPAPGKDNRARINLTVLDAGILEKTTLLVGAGPDANFDLEADNTVLEAIWTKTKGGIVVSQGAFLDGDGDSAGIVTDNSKTCVVLAKYSEMYPKDHPLVKKATFEARVRVFPKAIGGNEPVTFAYEEEMISGRINSITIKNRAGGTEFVKGDTMTVRLETTVANTSDTLKHAVVEIVMNPGQDLNSELDNSCYAIHVTSEKKFGFERTAEFNFISAHPILYGQEPTAGTFDGKATYANGKTASLNGSFSPTGFSAEFTGPDGGTAKVEYSKSGNLLSGGNI